MTGQIPCQAGGWPRLRLSEWGETRDTLHMWTRIVGKVRMVSGPLVTTGAADSSAGMFGPRTAPG
jgi:hypothetical protein